MFSQNNNGFSDDLLKAVREATAKGPAPRNPREVEEAHKKAGTRPKKHSALAALAPPYDEVTQRDVLTGRGVKKEEFEQMDEAKDKRKRSSYIVKVHYHPVTHGGITGGRQGHTGRDDHLRPIVKKRIQVPDAFSPEHAISHVQNLMRQRGHDVVGIKLDKNQKEEFEQVEEANEPAAPNQAAIERRKRLQAIQDKKDEKDAAKPKDKPKSHITQVKGRQYQGLEQPDDMKEELFTDAELEAISTAAAKL